MLFASLRALIACVPGKPCLYVFVGKIFIEVSWPKKKITNFYRITRMFCEYQTFANFAMGDQFATIKINQQNLN